MSLPSWEALTKSLIKKKEKIKLQNNSKLPVASNKERFSVSLNQQTNTEESRDDPIITLFVAYHTEKMSSFNNQSWNSFCLLHTFNILVLSCRLLWLSVKPYKNCNHPFVQLSCRTAYKKLQFLHCEIEITTQSHKCFILNPICWRHHRKRGYASTDCTKYYID